VILSPPERPVEAKSDLELPRWSKLPLEESNVGAYLETGEWVCLVGEPGRQSATLIVPQEKVEFVQPGQQVDIRLDYLPGQVIGGEVDSVSAIDLEELPRSLAVSGRVAVTEAAGSARPSVRSYQVVVDLEDSSGDLLERSLGVSRIHTKRRSLGARLMRSAASVFQLRM